jgi:predicted ABC-type ATPase
MLSILPEADTKGFIPDWAAELRDTDQIWMKVAQKGVEAFVAQAMVQKVPFAMETVFSHWQVQEDGTIDSKIRLIEQLQDAGYFVLLVFVGLSNSALSVARVSTRVESGGHAVDTHKLLERFPRTRMAICNGLSVADAAILNDNSLDEKRAYSVCRIQLKAEEVFDIRREGEPPKAITEWLNVVSPMEEGAG